MVKVTEKYLIRKFDKKPQIQPRKKGETDKEYLNRVTHLYLQSQFIDQIAPMTDCSSVSVIYLQNNMLQSIHNMDSFPNLTHLYLQRNSIFKIENLSCLKKLRKLYLGWNEISVVEGLEELHNLTELHMEKQLLPEGGTVYFEPRTIKNLSQSLRVLNLAGNRISSIRGLSDMARLQVLMLNDNRIQDMNDVVDTVASLPELKNLTLIGNPITSDRKYREALTLASSSLRTLDEKEITSESRTFVENLVLKKEMQTQQNSHGPKPMPKCFSEMDKPRMQNKAFNVFSGSRLFPLLKMQYMKMPRTVSTFSANMPPHYFSTSLRALQYTPDNNSSFLNYK